MKKRILAMLLALCMVLSLGTGAFADGEEPEEPAGLPDGMWDKMTDEQRAKYEEYLEFKEAKDGQSGEAEEAETAEVNEYGLTDAAAQALAGKIRAHLREDYLNVYGIAASEFSWPEAESDVWRAIVAVPNMAYSAGMSLTDAPEQLGNTFEDESLNALAGAVASALREWVLEEGNDSFEALWGSLTDGRTFSQFVTEYATFRPAKTAEDEVTDQDLQELLTCIGKAVEDEYLTPSGIDPAALAWPTDPATFRYFDEMFTNYCISALTGEPPAPVRDDYVPASPDKEIMDAVYAGVMNWLDGFASVDYEYLIALSQQINTFEYVLEYLPANLTFA